MRYTEETLQGWTVPLSLAEEQRAENSLKMIRSAINGDEELKKMNIDIFVQGSFANNTNVRSESDIDVCVMLKDVFHCDFPDGKGREDYGFLPATLSFEVYRDMVKKALQQKFKADNVVDGDKSLKINENTYHVQADVVPAFLLRNYYYKNSTDPNTYIEGTWFKSKSGKEVKNYPKIHFQNGKEKNKNTNYKYKKLVRIMKHIKNNMVDAKITNGDKITSFLVECLVWNIPNSKITGYSTWIETVRESILYLFSEIEASRHTKWGEVSEILYLFRGRKWTDQDVKQWLTQAWDYLGYR